MGHRPARFFFTRGFILVLLAGHAAWGQAPPMAGARVIKKGAHWE